jgi:hypothetical protein
VRLLTVEEGGVEDGAFAMEFSGGGGEGGGAAGRYFQHGEFGA